ncbi:MAG: TIGR01777 family protein [Candidatus Hydrogenedentes bacterium]|nr:TIGR01777 family protein [Candidatus Hydrogenedentota bacterium]
MKVLMSGASGLIGTAFRHILEADGHKVYCLVRGEPVAARQVHWAPDSGRLDPAALDGLDVLVHLSGEPVMGLRWNTAKKRAIRDSRVLSTTLLCDALSKVPNPPKVWLCASAIGYYGSRGDEPLDESSAAGTGFLSDVCQEWEAATDPARKRGVRVVNLRFGVVLSPQGGALKAMLTPFRMGLGGVQGDGRQYMSWITLRDAGEAFMHLLSTENVEGPVNLVSPTPVTNREFARILGKVLRRPAVLPLPAFAVRLAMGEMADETVLASARVHPKRLLESGFSFAHPDLEMALQAILYPVGSD